MNMIHLGRGAAAIVLPSFLFACGGSGGGGGNAGPQNPEPQLQIAQSDTAAANGINGIVHASTGIYAAGFSDQADDRTVVLGYNADGSVNESFGTDGVLSLNLKTAAGGDTTGDSGAEEAFGIVELDDGDLLLAVNIADGVSGGQSVYLVRLDSQNGFSVVSDYGDDGGSGLMMGVEQVVFGWANADNGSFPNGDLPSDTAYDLLKDERGNPDEDRVVINGFGPAAMGTGTPQATDRDRYVVRLMADTGEPDPTFASNGVFTYSTPRGDNSGDNGRRASIEADGSILSAGYTDLGQDQDNHVVLIKLDPNGALDPSFGNFVTPTPPAITAEPGVAVFNPFRAAAGFAECYAAEAQTNGDYVTTGYGRANGGTAPPDDDPLSTYEDATDNDLVTFRVAGGTSVDAGFGNPAESGTQAIQSEGTDFAAAQGSTEERGRDMVMLSNDKSVHVGRYAGVAALYVFTADGQLDTSIDDDGIITLPHDDVQNTGAPVTEQFFTAELSADGTLAVGTRGNDPAGARLLVISGLADSQ